MRRALIAGLTLLVLPVAAIAQSRPYLAVVGDAPVQLRAGPSDKLPATFTLPPGAPIVVVEEVDNGWLAVQDPVGKAYSMSWVANSMVDFNPAKPVPQPVTVEEETTLAAGQIGLAQPLHVRKVKVPAGTGLLVSDRRQFEGGSGIR